jgi:tetratricopeptide (TPR) repeat protein
MKARVSWAVLLPCLGCAYSAAVAQKAPAQRTIAVVVADAHTEPAQPVPTVRVALSYLDSAVLVTEVRGVTNPRGQTWLDVSEEVAQRGGLRIEIAGASNLVIYQPADGQLSTLPGTINVSVLPKGSSALLGPAQIEAMLHRTLVQVSALQKQVTALKQNAAAQNQKPDLGAALAEWAQANGFSDDQVKQQVEQWAQGIQRQSAQATTAEQKALAELALNHYANAAQLFNEAGDADRQQIDSVESQEKALQAQVQALQAAQQALMEKLRTPLRQLLDHSEQAAGAYRLNLQYHQATLTLESAEAAADAEYKKHPEDKGFHELWLQAVWDTADARWREGEVAAAGESLALLAQSASDFQSLAREYAVLGDRQEAAAAHDGLGVALEEEGERVSGDKAAGLLDEAVQAYRSALEVYTQAELPRYWAATQNNLGIALMHEADRASGDKAAGLLDEAVRAYRSALEVCTKADLPQDWAGTQNNLGIALMHEGEGASGDKAASLLDEAVRAYRSALEVYTKANLPQEWASTQNNLGIALMDAEEWAGADKAAGLLDQAVQAYRSALEVRTKADLPQDWAATQNNLGLALEEEGELAGGDRAVALFDQADQAYRSALEVYTKADLPEKWAGTQMNLMELNLWAGHFTVCLQQAAVLDDSTLPPPGLAIRDAMKLACQWGTGDRGAAAATETALASKPPVFQTDFWDFTGTIHFLSHSPSFEKGRASWIALFTSLQNGDSAGMTAALRQIEPLLQK